MTMIPPVRPSTPGQALHKAFLFLTTTLRYSPDDPDLWDALPYHVYLESFIEGRVEEIADKYREQDAAYYKEEADNAVADAEAEFRRSVQDAANDEDAEEGLRYLLERYG